MSVPVQTPVEAFVGQVLPPERATALYRGLPAHIKPERFERNLFNALMANPDLIKYDPRLVYREVSKAAALGLYLDPQLGEAYIIEAWNAKAGRKEPQLRIGYRGVAKLAKQSGEIAQLYSHEVCQYDKIVCHLGDEKKLLHEPDLFGDRGDIVGYYAVAKFTSGETDFEPMTVRQIHAIRDRSDAYQAFRDGKIKSTPWATDESEMARKTVMKRLLKRLPQSPELADAIRIEDEAEQVVDVPRLTGPRTPPPAPERIGARATVVDVSGHQAEGEHKIIAGLKEAVKHAKGETIDNETGEITEIADAREAGRDSPGVVARERGQAESRESAPSTDVRGAGLDSLAAAHQRDSAAAASPGPSTNEASRQRVQSGGGKGTKEYLDEDRADEKLAVQASAANSDPDAATKAFMAYAKDLGSATEADEAEAIRDGYMTQHGMAWTREQKEQAAHLYAMACTRIEAAEADAARDEVAESDDFPGDTPAEDGEPAAEAVSEAAPAAETATKAKRPPKAPKPASEAQKPATKPAVTEAPETASQYLALFNSKFAAVETIEQAKALKSWWFASSSQRNSCGCSDALKETMRNQWTERLIFLQGQP